MTQHPAIALSFDDLGSGHPSALWLLFDVELNNDDDRPRWFILPAHVRINKPDAPPFSVFGADVWRLNARASVPYVKFIGSEGFQAVRLPARAAVRIRHVPIVWFGALPKDAVPIRCAIADDITIEGESADAWLGIDVTAPEAAEADYDERDLVHSVKARAGAEQPATLVGVRPIDITTRIAFRN